MTGRRFLHAAALLVAAVLGAVALAWAGEAANVARGERDAVLSVRLPSRAGAATLSTDWAVEFEAVPLSVQPTAPFLVEVSVRTAKGDEQSLGIVSLAPPVTPGETRRFMLPLPPPVARANARDGAITLTVGLVPAVPSDALDDTAVRIENARISS